METSSRHLRIFISSTFRDMQQEREELVKHVFPRIKKIARERFVEITEVDLRWGVTPEQSESGESLKICLDEISKCKTSPIFLIGMMGERYGWIPDITDDKLLNDPKYQWLKNYKDKSVTELEIRPGVLDHLAQESMSYFYFRDKWLSSRIENELIINDTSYVKEDSLLQVKQDALKDEIRGTKKHLSVDGYESIDEFGEKVFEDLKAELDRLFPEDKIPTELERIRLTHLQFAESRKKIYIEDKQQNLKVEEFSKAKSIHIFAYMQPLVWAKVHL